MNNDKELQGQKNLHPELELEIVEVEIQSDHQKLMRAYEKLNKKLDALLEKKKHQKISQDS